MASLSFSRISPRRKSRTRVLLDGREILSGYAYQKRRLEVLRRDQFSCVRCGCRYSGLHIHHVNKRSILRDDRADNLITLCERFHRADHKE